MRMKTSLKSRWLTFLRTNRKSCVEICAFLAIIIEGRIPPADFPPPPYQALIALPACRGDDGKSVHLTSDGNHGTVSVRRVMHALLKLFWAVSMSDVDR